MKKSNLNLTKMRKKHNFKRKTLPHFKFDGRMSQNLESRPWLLLCNVSSSFNNHNHPGIEETSCWTFGRRLLSHSFLMWDSSCSLVLGYLYCVFLFNNVLQFNSAPELFHYQLINSVCGLALPCNWKAFQHPLVKGLRSVTVGEWC